MINEKMLTAKINLIKTYANVVENNNKYKKSNESFKAFKKNISL